MKLTPLRVYSEYSLLYSCIRSKSVPKICKKHGITSIAIADPNNMFGSLNWSLGMQENEIKPIIGCDLKLINKAHAWVFCKNETGYIELSNLLSDSYIKHNGELEWQELIRLKNCIILIDHTFDEKSIGEFAKECEKHNIELGIAISRQVNDAQYEPNLFNISNKFDIPIVAAPKFYYEIEGQKLAVDALWCIRNNTYLAETDREHVINDGYLDYIGELEAKFSDIPFALENCNIIAQKCNFALQKHEPRMPGLDNITDAPASLRDMVYEGLEMRLNSYVFPEAILAKNNYNNVDSDVSLDVSASSDESLCLENNLNKNIDSQASLSNEEQESLRKQYYARAEHELEMIIKMGFCEYFLIVADIVQWSKKNDIPVGPGRGSGASCLIAWCLQITNINPIYFNLMFERFLNPDRVSLPDFDIDFCQENRHLVIEYIQQRFGQENVAHILTFGTLQYRAAVRDVGRVMQIPYPVVDYLCKKLPQPVQGVAPTLKELREKGILQEFINSENAELFMVAESVEGLPRHASMHAAGLVIGNQKLSDIVPLIKEADSEIPVIQCAMKQAEQIGLVKFDILGLTILSTLKQTTKLVKKNHNIDLALDHIKLDDPKTFEILQKGLIKGIFQFDTPGFRQLMLQMKPTYFEDLIAAGALYRPGPMGDIPNFIQCKKDPSKAQYLYEQMEPILKDTYGVIVYQEQVLQIAKNMAGYSLKEADLLRRAMGKKIKAEMAMHEEKFINGILEICKDTKEKAQTLFNNLARFASYGFPKAHAAPYAVMSYQSAYCKAHFPYEFFCATLMYEPLQERMEEVIQEAKKSGMNIFGPALNISESNFSVKTINNEPAIIFGLSKIKGVGEIANTIIEERNNNGPFKSISDFIKRINPNKKVLENFVYSGTFDCFNISRAKQFKEISDTNSSNTISLFDSFEETIDEWVDIEIMKNEFNTMRMLFSESAFIEFPKLKIHNKLENIVKPGGLLLCIGLGDNTRKTKDGKIMHSYQFIDKNGVQENLLNNWDENITYPKWEMIIIETERSDIRYTVKKIHSVQEFLSQYKKMFFDIKNNELKTLLEKNCAKLEEGDTSIYYQFESAPIFVGNFCLTFEFLQAMYDHIKVIT